MEASPVNTHSKSEPDKIPEIRRVVVPLLPASRVWVGLVNPCKPFPCTSTRSLECSMSIPILRKHAMVERQSAPSKKFVISVVPLAREPNIMALWEMDLSPGIFTCPCNESALFICIEVFLFCKSYIYVKIRCLTFIDSIMVFAQKGNSLLQRIFIIHFNMQYTVFEFTIVNDADVFHT